MSILTSIGEIGVEAGGRQVKFRPSLAAMTRIGTPAEIVETFVAVCGTPPLTGNEYLDTNMFKRWRREQFNAALSVLLSCTEEPIDWLVGYVNERLNYVRGLLPLEDIVGLAMGLLKHGVMGDLPARDVPQGEDGYVSEFKARDFALAAMAHLGATEADAWNMTMTSYIGAMRSKFPPAVDAKSPPSEKEHDHVMSWLDKVNKARKEAANHE